MKIQLTESEESEVLTQSVVAQVTGTTISTRAITRNGTQIHLLHPQHAIWQMGYIYKLKKHNTDYTSMLTGRYPHRSMRPDTNLGYPTRTTTAHLRHYHSWPEEKRTISGSITVTHKSSDGSTNYLDDHFQLRLDQRT